MKTKHLRISICFFFFWTSLNMSGLAQQFTNSFQRNLILYGEMNTLTFPLKHPENTRIYVSTTDFIEEVNSAWANPYFTIDKTETPGTYQVSINSTIESQNTPFDMNTKGGKFFVLDGNDTNVYYFNIIYPKYSRDICLSIGFDKNINISKIDSNIRILPYCTLEDYPIEVLKTPDINHGIKVVSYTLYASGGGFPNVKMYYGASDRLPNELIKLIKDKNFKNDKKSFLTFENIRLMTPKGMVRANPITFSISAND